MKLTEMLIHANFHGWTVSQEKCWPGSGSDPFKNKDDLSINCDRGRQRGGENICIFKDFLYKLYFCVNGPNAGTKNTQHVKTGKTYSDARKY